MIDVENIEEKNTTLCLEACYENMSKFMYLFQYQFYAFSCLFYVMFLH